MSTFPSPSELRLRVVANLQDVVTEFHNTVEKAMHDQAGKGKQQITVGTQRIPEIVVTIISNQLKDAGWAVEHVHDQRDGNFLRITVPKD